MATFVQIGQHWINLDLVTSVQIVPVSRDARRAFVSTTGQKDSVELREPDEIQALEEALRNYGEVPSLANEIRAQGGWKNGCDAVPPIPSDFP